MTSQKLLNHLEVYPQKFQAQSGPVNPAGTKLPVVPEDQVLFFRTTVSDAPVVNKVRRRVVKPFRRLNVFRWKRTQTIARNIRTFHKLRQIFYRFKISPQAEEQNAKLPTAPLKGTKRVQGKSAKEIRRLERLRRRNLRKPQSDENPKPPRSFTYSNRTIILPPSKDGRCKHCCELVTGGCYCVQAWKQCVDTGQPNTVKDLTEVTGLNRNTSGGSETSSGGASQFSEHNPNDAVPIDFDSAKNTEPKSETSDSTEDMGVGGVVLENMESISKSCPDNLSPEHKKEWDNFMAHVEKILIFAYHMLTANNWGDILMGLLTLIRFYHKGSMVNSLFRTIKEVVCSTGVSDETPIMPNSIGSDLRDNWNLFKNHKMFSKFSYLITAGMSLSVCKIKEIHFNPAGIQLINLEAQKKQHCAFDLIDAVIETFTWVHDTGSQVFQTKSLAPLLFSDQRVKELNELCDYITLNAERVINGNSKIAMTDFLNKINKAQSIVAQMKNVKSDGAPRVVATQI